MRRLLREADKKHIPLYLDAYPKKGARMQGEALQAWYSRLGFKPWGTSKKRSYMVREPKLASQTPSRSQVLMNPIISGFLKAASEADALAQLKR